RCPCRCSRSAARALSARSSSTWPSGTPATSRAPCSPAVTGSPKKARNSCLNTWCRSSASPASTVMSVQVTQDAEFGPVVVDLFVKLVKHERGLVILGVWASGGSQRLPPGSRWQLLEKVLPESVRTVQDGHGLRGSGRCRVIPLKPAGRSLHSQPLRVPFP